MDKHFDQNYFKQFDENSRFIDVFGPILEDEYEREELEEETGDKTVKEMYKDIARTIIDNYNLDYSDFGWCIFGEYEELDITNNNYAGVSVENICHGLGHYIVDYCGYINAGKSIEDIMKEEVGIPTKEWWQKQAILELEDTYIDDTEDARRWLDELCERTQDIHPTMKFSSDYDEVLEQFEEKHRNEIEDYMFGLLKNWV